METCDIDESDKSHFEFDYENYKAEPLPTEDWMLPMKDFWEPQQPLNARFRSKEAQVTHYLTQREIYARYATHTSSLPFGRIKVIRQALMYKTETDRQKAAGNARYNKLFNEQDYLDFAAVADQNRPIAVDQTSYIPARQLVAVNVSSYALTNEETRTHDTMPKNGTLQTLLGNRPMRRNLKRESSGKFMLI
jgi:hypothetical protein